MPAARKKAPAKKVAAKKPRIKSSSRGRKAAVAIQKQAAPLAAPVIRGVFAMILDAGVIVTATTELDSPPVSLIQTPAMALAKPSTRSKKAPPPLFSVVAPDNKLGRDVPVYLGFISTQEATVTPGANTFSARFAYSARKTLDVAFNVTAQPLANFKPDQITNLFLLLHEPLSQLLSVALAPEHPFARSFHKFQAEQRARLEWEATKVKVKQAVDAKQPEQAIKILVPNVFCETPAKEAEKLLGDLLFGALPAEQRKKFEDPALKNLQVEALLLRHALAAGQA